VLKPKPPALCAGVFYGGGLPAQRKIKKNLKKISVLFFFPLPELHLVCIVKKPLKPAAFRDF
jgi:hypothetical protein